MSGGRKLQAAIGGLKIETEGRWADEKTDSHNGTRARLYRMFITCCAADSRAMGLLFISGGE